MDKFSLKQKPPPAQWVPSTTPWTSHKRDTSLDPIAQNPQQYARKQRSTMASYPIEQKFIRTSHTNVHAHPLEGPYIGHRLATDNRGKRGKGMRTGPSAQLLTPSGQWVTLDKLIEANYGQHVKNYIDLHPGMLTSLAPLFTIVQRKFRDEQRNLTRPYLGVVYQLDVSTTPFKGLTHEISFLEDGDYCCMSPAEYTRHLNEYTKKKCQTTALAYQQIQHWRTRRNYNDTVHQNLIASRQSNDDNEGYFTLKTTCLERLCAQFNKLLITSRSRKKSNENRRRIQKTNQRPNFSLQNLFYDPVRLAKLNGSEIETITHAPPGSKRGVATLRDESKLDGFFCVQYDDGTSEEIDLTTMLARRTGISRPLSNTFIKPTTTDRDSILTWNIRNFDHSNSESLKHMIEKLHPAIIFIQEIHRYSFETIHHSLRTLIPDGYKPV
jgi:hypothetical protein